MHGRIVGYRIVQGQIVPVPTLGCLVGSIGNRSNHKQPRGGESRGSTHSGVVFLVYRTASEATERPLPADSGDQILGGRQRELRPHFLHRQKHQGLFY